jgi:hypothetical protein
MKKNKIDKDNSGKKIHKKRERKPIWGNTLAIHSVLKKKKLQS